MPVRDLFHNAVSKALQKEGWIITHDPFLAYPADYLKISWKNRIFARLSNVTKSRFLYTILSLKQL